MRVRVTVIYVKYTDEATGAWVTYQCNRRVNPDRTLGDGWDFTLANTGNNWRDNATNREAAMAAINARLERLKPVLVDETFTETHRR